MVFRGKYMGFTFFKRDIKPEAFHLRLSLLRCVCLFLSTTYYLLPTISHAAAPYAGNFYAEGSPKKAEFALTYDDGPGYITEELLKLLEKYGVKATFFMQGPSLRQYPERAAKVAAAGHLIGNHTDRHLFYPKVGKSPGREKVLEKELDSAAALIEKSAGKRPALLRMPNGYVKDWVKKTAAAKGYVIVNWTYGSDWTALPEDRMSAEYLKALRPGAILLLHDGGGKKREKTLRITEKLLQEAARKGLKAVALDELLGLGGSRW